jgi:hypothetical protein
MRELGLYWDDPRSPRARAHHDDPYASYKEAIVQLPDIAAYRAAVASKLAVYGVSELVDAPAIKHCATGIVETAVTVGVGLDVLRSGLRSRAGVTPL